MSFRSRLVPFLVASLVMHVAAVILWPAQQATTSEVTAGTLRIALAPTPAGPADASDAVAGEGLPHVPSPSRRTSERAAESSLPQQPIRASAPMASEGPAAIDAGDDGLSEGGAAEVVSEERTPRSITAAGLVDLLQAAVVTHFYYPPLARRRGWEGEVRIALRVEGDGQLTAIRIVSSSGHRLLDHAAVDTLTRLARLPDADGLPEGGMETILPVRYRLLDAPA